jgi:hypothetical protein
MQNIISVKFNWMVGYSRLRIYGTKFVQMKNNEQPAQAMNEAAQCVR